MRRTATSASLAACTLIAASVIATSTAHAQSWRWHAASHRQETKNTWRNLAIGSGVLGVIGLLNNDGTLALLGSAGAGYSAWRYEQDRRSQNRIEHGGYGRYYTPTYYTSDYAPSYYVPETYDYGYYEPSYYAAPVGVQYVYGGYYHRHLRHHHYGALSYYTPTSGYYSYSHSYGYRSPHRYHHYTSYYHPYYSSYGSGYNHSYHRYGNKRWHGYGHGWNGHDNGLHKGWFKHHGRGHGDDD